jgi:ABC-type branched-subunit amino acid transport system substrate-binding protein
VVAEGLILFSSSNTAAELSTIDDKGLYFRTAPSDILQGGALADVILRDGSHKIVIVARKDSYGEGLQRNVQEELEKAGVAPSQLKLLTYEPPPDADAPVASADELAGVIKEFHADAVLIIGFNESADVIKALAAAGIELQH